ncbi:MAG TPA: hypothetical protein VGX03_37110, partial [Candidatus Binatia bacterium]|nr:hypothetical protein [Candidatus Binatia bacterium]
DSVEVDQIGEYRLVGSRYRATLYANLFDEAESDIGRREDDDTKPVPISEARPPQELSRTVPAEFGRWLYYGAVLLLLIEWLYALWRYRRASES